MASDGYRSRTHSISGFPTFVSSGFTTVDLIATNSLRASPGGTATNVARALRSLGWRTSVVGTVGNDPAGRFVKAELAKDGVGVGCLRLDNSWTTPVVLQEEHRGDHVWRFSCPICGARFAKHRPTPVDEALSIISTTEAPDVFFFDRVSLFTLTLAKNWSAYGTYVVFEPAGLGRPHLFDQAIEVADLVKYSSERAPTFEGHMYGARGALVETLGPGGARYKSSGSNDWLHVPGNDVDNMVDSAGAGDWTSAGIINELFAAADSENGPSLRQAVLSGQDLGALACGWEGVFPLALQLIDVDFELFACPRVLAALNEKA